jgi:hypothetical protein
MRPSAPATAILIGAAFVVMGVSGVTPAAGL